MATISPSQDFSGPARAAAAGAAAPVRDLRLDFFRGIAMFIILIAHIPGNAWGGWIPARFGFSDATEIFVFCSGMASAIAFGGSYARRGWGMGTARVGYRVWQVYWAHLGLFFAVAAMMAAFDLHGGFDKDYVRSLNLQHFFDDPMPQLVGAFTLTYVPNYFDILPMYMVVLALMPLIMALARVRVGAAIAASLLIWAGANTGLLSLPAEPWSDRDWFFNPFGWQLLFFTGFAFMLGWLPQPPVSRVLVGLAAAYLLLSAPIGSWKVFTWIDAAHGDLGAAIRPIWAIIRDFEDATGINLRGKTDFGIFRYLHFLSLAYLAWVAVGDGGRRLAALADGPGAGLVAVIVKVGQQSLAVFVFSMALARLIGFAFDQLGRSAGVVAAGNLIGFALLIGLAYLVAWMKSQPWRSKRT